MAKKKSSKEEISELIDEASEDLEDASGTIEEIEDFVEESIKTEEEAREDGAGKAIAITVDQEQVNKLLDRLKEKDEKIKRIAERGLYKTGKNVIVFYEQASKAGERFRGLIFMMLGLSVVLAGTYVTRADLFTLRDLIIPLLATDYGGILVVAAGFSLFAYGSNKLFRGAAIPLKRLFKKEEKSKYVQKKLI